MKSNKGLLWALTVFILLIIAFWGFQRSRGLHLEWSPNNWRFVWVDKDGKP